MRPEYREEPCRIYRGREYVSKEIVEPVRREVARLRTVYDVADRRARPIVAPEALELPLAG